MKRLIPVLLLGSVLNISAAEPLLTNRVITLQFVTELAEIARTNNSSLWAQRSRIAAAEHNVKSIPLWKNPEVMAGGMAAERMMRAEDGDIMYGVEQELPVFGKPQAARRVAEADVLVEQASLEAAFQDVRKNLAQALFNAALADDLIAIADEDLAWLNTLTAAVEQSYQAGRASQVDVLRAQNERSKRVQDRASAEAGRDSAYVSVNRILNWNTISAWPEMRLPEAAGPLTDDLKLAEMALRFEPRLRALREELRRGKAMVVASRREKRPDLSVAAEARQYSGTGEPRSGEVLLKLSLPWLNFGKYNSAIRRDEAKVQEIEQLIEDYGHQVSAEVHHLVAKVNTARRQALLYRDEIIPRSRQALASAQASWQSSRDAFRDVLDARRMLLDARTMYARSIAEQYIMLVELVTCCGLADLESLEPFLGAEPATTPVSPISE